MVPLYVSEDIARLSGMRQMDSRSWPQLACDQGLVELRISMYLPLISVKLLLSFIGQPSSGRTKGKGKCSKTN